MNRKKYHEPAPIAETEQEWRQIEHLISEHIVSICDGNAERATLLTNLLFVLTDEDFDAMDRGVAAEHAVRTAFSFSSLSVKTLTAHLSSLRSPKGKPLAEVKAVSV